MLDRSDNPYEQVDGVTDLQEQVLELLERAGLSTEINDRIMRLVAEGERSALSPTTPYEAPSTPNDEATDELRPSRSTPNDE